MSKKPSFANHIWTYCTCKYQEEFYMLLARRMGYENLFWHVATARLVEMPRNSRTVDVYFKKAREAIEKELNVNSSKVEVSQLFRDKTNSSSWIDNETCVHMLADFGFVWALPEFTPIVSETPNGPKGIVRAEWAKLADIKVCPENSKVTLPKSDHQFEGARSEIVFYKGLPLRSMVARVLAERIVPYLAPVHSQSYEKLSFLCRRDIRKARCGPPSL